MKKNHFKFYVVLLTGFLLFFNLSNTFAAEGYCASGGNDSSAEWIENIVVSNQAFTSGNNGGYFEHTNATAVMKPGVNQILFAPGFADSSRTEYWRAWLDINDDKTFSDDEIIFEHTGSSTAVRTIHFPSDISSGLAMLRISMKYGDAPLPCESFDWGETEDILVSIENPAADMAGDYALSIDENLMVSRNGELGDAVVWVVEKDDNQVLIRNAANELSYTYHNNTPGSTYRIWLALAGGDYPRISNIVEYTVGENLSHELTLGEEYQVSRSGNLGESVLWVVERNGSVVLKRSAANELSYTYYNNSPASEYRVWLEQYINGSYQRVSNIVEYAIPQYNHTLSVDSSFGVSRDGSIGDPVQWVIEEDGEIVLTRVASNELIYTYFNNKGGSNYRVWLQQYVDGQYQVVSNIVDYQFVENYPYEVALGDNYEIQRSGVLGESVQWVIERNNVKVLTRNAANELSYTYYNNVEGSNYRVWLQKYINGSYLRVSNIVEYSVAALPFSLSVDDNYEITRTGALGDPVQWVIEEDGEQVLARVAGNELSYTYYNNKPGSHYRVWLQQYINGYQVVSNIVEYTVSSAGEYQLTLGEDYEIQRSGVLGESLTWVIERNGSIVLQRIAANELSYTYYNNLPGSTYRVWLKKYINGAYQQVSNAVQYTVGALSFSVDVDENYVISRSGQSGNAVRWVIEQDYANTVTRTANYELNYLHFNNQPGSSYRVWLEAMVDGEYETVSNIAEYSVAADAEPPAASYEITLDDNYQVNRSGSLGDNVQWVIVKNGNVVLRRNASNELSYTYFSNTSGSDIFVYLQQTVDDIVQPVSNVVSYSVP